MDPLSVGRLKENARVLITADNTATAATTAAITAWNGGGAANAGAILAILDARAPIPGPAAAALTAAGRAETVAAYNAYLAAYTAGQEVCEYKPHFHEWATALPSMICLTRKARNATFRNYVAAETATPVITCAACLTPDDAKNFYFAGVCRSKSVRPIDDGVGPQVDEYFTLAIGGMVTLLNNSKDAVFPGDMLEWTLYNEKGMNSGAPAKRQKVGPRRVGIKPASPTSERVIGR